MSDLELYDFDGLRFWATEPDSLALREVIEEDVYRIRDFAFEPGDTVIDIGAHVGAFCVSVAARFPSVRVIAVEPSPENFKLLQRNIELNAVKVEAFHAGLWKDSDGLDLMENGSLTVTGPGSTVASVTLDHLLGDTYCRFLKVDCEGAEVPALLAASRWALKKVNYIAGEFHGLSTDWGHWVRYLGSVFSLTIESHPDENYVFGGMFRGVRR